MEDSLMEKQIIDLCYTHILNNYYDSYHIYSPNGGLSMVVVDGEEYASTIIRYMLKNNLTVLYRLKLVHKEPTFILQLDDI